jgi:hypothetical protein
MIRLVILFAYSVFLAPLALWCLTGDSFWIIPGTVLLAVAIMLFPAARKDWNL